MSIRRATLFIALLIAPAVLLAQDSGTHDEPSLERAARRYRIVVYQLYRADRDEFNRRLTLATEVLDDWNTAKRDPLFAKAAESWFETATTTMRRSRDAALPPLPHVPKGLAQSGSSPNSVHPEHRTSSPPTESPDANSLPPSHANGDAAGVSSQDATERLSDSEHEAPHVPADRLAPFEAPGIPPTRPPYPRDSHVLHESLPQIHFHRHTDQFAHVTEDTLQQKPTAVVGILSTAGGATNIAQQAALDAEPQIDVDVLNAKILHFNLQVTEVESELRNGTDWTTNSLIAMADQIDQLIAERNHITLFFDLLTPERREGMVEIASSNAARALFAQRMFELRIERANRTAEFNTVEHAQWLRKMEALATRLDSWNRDE